MPNAARSALDVSSVMTTSSIESIPDEDDEDDDVCVAAQPALACSRPTRRPMDEPEDDDEEAAEDAEQRNATVAGAP